MQYNAIIVCLLLAIAFSNAKPDTSDSVHEMADFPESRKNKALDSIEIDNNGLDTNHVESKFAELDLEDSSEGEGRKKIKIKKKHKKFLMEALMGGVLIKSALLPLAVGFLKLLTGKALLMTLLALGLAMALTFKSATEKTVTTEVINLVPHHSRHRRSLSDVIQLHQLATALNPKKYG